MFKIISENSFGLRFMLDNYFNELVIIGICMQVDEMYEGVVCGEDFQFQEDEMQCDF